MGLPGRRQICQFEATIVRLRAERVGLRVQRRLGLRLYRRVRGRKAQAFHVCRFFPSPSLNSLGPNTTVKQRLSALHGTRLLRPSRPFGPSSLRVRVHGRTHRHRQAPPDGHDDRADRGSRGQAAVERVPRHRCPSRVATPHATIHRALYEAGKTLCSLQQPQTKPTDFPFFSGRCSS